MKKILHFIFSILLKPVRKNKKLYFYFQDNFFTGSADFLFRLRFFHASPDVCTGYILDVGAANGNVSDFFLKSYPKAKKVIGFEPNKLMWKELEDLDKNNTRFELIKKGVGENNELKEFYVTENDFSSSFHKVNIDELNKNGKTFQEAMQLKSVNTIEIVRLDDVVPDDVFVSIIKMDTQGSELNVLKGAEKTLKRTDIVVTEVQNYKLYDDACQYYEVDNYLRSKGFVLIDIIVSYRNENKELNEFDMIYKRK